MPTQTTGSSQPSQEPIKKSSALTPSSFAAKILDRRQKFVNLKMEKLKSLNLETESSDVRPCNLAGAGLKRSSLLLAQKVVKRPIFNIMYLALFT